MANFGPPTSEVGSRVSGTPANFNGFAPAFVIATTSLSGCQPNFAFARCLAISCTGTLYIHFWGLFPPDRILPGAKFTLRLSLTFA